MAVRRMLERAVAGDARHQPRGTMPAAGGGLSRWVQAMPSAMRSAMWVAISASAALFAAQISAQPSAQPSTQPAAQPTAAVSSALSAATVATANAADQAEPPLRPVGAPHYGDTLFQFFQARYFASLTALMVSQHFARLDPHDDEAEVLRGGLYLSYGLHREAGDIFAKLIERNAPRSVRDRAWFYLAKIRYQRGFDAEAEAALAKVEQALPGDLEDDRLLLQANLLMARGDFNGAARVLDAPAGGAASSTDRAAETNTNASTKASTTISPYARFNLGVALVKTADPDAVARGTALLEAVGKAPAANEELRSLRDKANVALGFGALQAEAPEKARGYLERVRLDGLHANKALLGFGWAAAALKQPADALVPWTELASRDVSDAAVLEAKLAVPYAYAELGAPGQSLALYEQAIGAYDAESAALDESVAAIGAGKLLQGLVEANPGGEMGWFWTIDRLPEMPHVHHLAQVLAQHRFQEAFKNYRDLQFVGNNLRDWQDQLVIYRDMLANRQQAFEQRLPRVRTEQGSLNIAALAMKGETLAAELSAAQADADGRVFADARQRALQQRLEAATANARALAEARVDGHPDAPTVAELSAISERLRRVGGALSWALAQAYPTRVWEAQKGVKVIASTLAQARQRELALAAAQRDEPARFASFAQRIDALQQRLVALLPRVDTLLAEQQQAVQTLAANELLGQKARLVVYANQARFAVAQLVDRAHSGVTGTGGAGDDGSDGTVKESAGSNASGSAARGASGGGTGGGSNVPAR